MSSDIRHLTGLTQSEGKDLKAEADWSQLNDILARAEAALETEPGPSKPLIFILGPPRSGSTLMSQVMAATGAFGVTTNFVARYWRAPAVGLHLERVLVGDGAALSFESVRGRTHGEKEPHEFGYFWSRWFDLGEETHSLSPEMLSRVDAAGLKRSLAAMEAAAGKPMMFKNNTWFTFQADWLAKTLPTAVIVACTRDPFFVAQSIYQQRVALGDAACWWSVRPAAYRSLLRLPPLAQVASQAVEIERDMERALAGVPANRLVRANYDRLCRDPRGIVAEVFGACGLDFDSATETGKVPENFKSTNTMRLSAEDANELRRLVSERLAKGY